MEGSNNSSKKRGPNFTSAEMKLLQEIVFKYASTIENKCSDAFSWKDKQNIWLKVQEEFNSRSNVCFRSANILRKKYDNMKTSLKDKVVGYRKHAFATGGGPPIAPPCLSTDEIQLFEVIGSQAVGLQPLCDDDTDAGTSFGVDTVMELAPSSTLHVCTENEEREGIVSPAARNEEKKIETKSWGDHTPNMLRSKRSSVLNTKSPEDIRSRYRKRSFTGTVTNKAWVELAIEKEKVAKLKIVSLEKEMVLKDLLIEKTRLENLKIEKELMLIDEKIIGEKLKNKLLNKEFVKLQD